MIRRNIVSIYEATDRKTERQNDRQTEKKTDEQTVRQTRRQTNSETCKLTKRKTYREKESHTGKYPWQCEGWTEVYAIALQLQHLKKKGKAWEDEMESFWQKKKKKEMRQSIPCGSCVQWMKRRVVTWLQIRMVAHHLPVDWRYLLLQLCNKWLVPFKPIKTGIAE